MSSAWTIPAWTVPAWVIPLLLGWLLDRIAGLIPLPQEWKSKIRLFFLHIKKIIWDPPSETTYNFKTKSLVQDKEKFDQIHKLIEVKGFIPAGNIGNFLKFTKDTGAINPEIFFKPTLLPDGEKLYLESIEFQITIDVTYNNFMINLQDLFRIKEDLQMCLLEDYGEFIGESLTCKLSKMYRFSGFLSEYNMSELTGEIHERKISFYPNKMLVMGPINSDILKIIKKAITFYY